MNKNEIPKSVQNGNKGKKINPVPAIAVASIGILVFAASGVGFAWAETGQTLPTDIQIKASDSIKNDPTAMKILYNIELFKQQYAAMQQRQQLIDQQNQFIEQQRKIADEYLQADLAHMNNANNLSTPKNAYAAFVNQVDNSTKGLFWDEFSYMQNKVLSGRLAMSKVLQSGGTMQDALQAYYDTAAVHKSQLVSLNKDLNVKYNLGNAKTQDLFNKLGNIQRS